MNAAFIVDASIAMAWCFQEEATPATIDVLNLLKTNGGVVPSHWFLEVANALAMAEVRRRITQVESDAFIALLGGVDLKMDEDVQSRAFSHILALARKHRLTTYDAAYLDLSIRRRLPLATLDADLRSAADSHGIELLGM